LIMYEPLQVYALVANSVIGVSFRVRGSGIQVIFGAGQRIIPWGSVSFQSCTHVTTVARCPKSSYSNERT